MALPTLCRSSQRLRTGGVKEKDVYMMCLGLLFSSIPARSDDHFAQAVPLMAVSENSMRERFHSLLFTTFTHFNLSSHTPSSPRNDGLIMNKLRL